MKKIKYIIVICLLSIIGISTHSLSIFNTMTTEEWLLLKNVEALSEMESSSILLAKYHTERVLITPSGSFLPISYNCCMPSVDTDYCDYGLLKCRDGKLD